MTLKQVFRKPITQQYPEYKRPVYPRFRGRHRLQRARERPREVRRLLALRRRVPGRLHPRRRGGEHADNRVSAGERYARIYEINMRRCIFCGYCELACPFDAITLGNDFEISEYNRDDLIYTKDMLLAPPVKRVPGRRPGPLRHADPLLQGIHDLQMNCKWRSQRSPIVVGNFLVWGVWFVAAFACLASALAVVSFSNPFYSALALIGNLASLAVLYLLLAGEFVAAGQVLVYGGAVMVMFLFVIAYLGDRTDEAPWSGGPSWQVVGAVLAGGAILVEICVVVGLEAGGFLDKPRTITRGVRLARVDRPLFLTDHLIAFEVTSIVLLVAAVGGVVLGSHARRIEGDARA